MRRETKMSQRLKSLQTHVKYLSNYTERQRTCTFSIHTVYTVVSVYEIFNGMPHFFDQTIPIILMVSLQFY